MFRQTAFANWFGRAAVLLAASFCVAEEPAAATLHVYGSEGPSPAMQESAMAFHDGSDVKVEVVSGPVTAWGDQAKDDADVIFCSAEFMMSALLRSGELGIDPATVTPLYMRPSAILVRPGNPKGIRDFPDLLLPGIRVMVVTGSGQTGLWEDMAGKRGDVRFVRAFRSNVVLFAPDSDAAQKAWKERDDIDAWVTWNIWYLPLHSHADIVPVSEDYVIYRQCNVALTERGKEKPAARQFVAFLASPDGAAIFRSWGWLTEPADLGPVAVKTDIAVVCRIDRDESVDGVGRGLLGVRRLVTEYQAAGVPEYQLHVVAVVQDSAAQWLLEDAAYRRVTGLDTDNPNKAIVEELAGMGVRVELCGATMRERGWTVDDLLPGVRLTADGYPRIVDLQLQGYAYLRL